MSNETENIYLKEFCESMSRAYVTRYEAGVQNSAATRQLFALDHVSVPSDFY